MPIFVTVHCHFVPVCSLNKAVFPRRVSKVSVKRRLVFSPKFEHDGQINCDKKRHEPGSLQMAETFHSIISEARRDHWGDLGIDGWIILGRISRRWDEGVWTGLGWPRIETGGGRL